MSCCLGFLYKIMSKDQQSLPQEQSSYHRLKDDNIQQMTTNNRNHTEIFTKINKQQKIGIDDFELLKKIGVGSNSHVYLARFRKLKHNDNIFAVKVVSKQDMHNSSQDKVLIERAIMSQVNSPFLMPIYFSFQSPENLYLVMEFMYLFYTRNGGDLLGYLQKNIFFKETTAVFYISEIVLAIEALHKKDIIHRDIKPENIVIGRSGHIKLADYGQAKDHIKQSQFTTTMCGSPNYLAPEILKQKQYNRSVDWWQLGILIYELLSGAPPFHDDSPYTLLQNIMTLNYTMRDHFSDKAKSLISQLLILDPQRRLGTLEDAHEIKMHNFFQKVHWEEMERLKNTPPYIPKVTHKIDTSNLNLVPLLQQEYIQNMGASSKKQYSLHDSMIEQTTHVEGFSYVDNKLQF